MSQRNPSWTHDEQILALDLYLQTRRVPLRVADVEELSALLNRLPLHPQRHLLSRFRSPAAVRLKLANFAALDPGYHGTGMTAIGRGDADIWDRYHNQPNTVRALARAIKRAADTPMAAHEEPGEDEAPEGRLLHRLHLARERNRSLVARRKRQAWDACGRLECEACGFDFARTYGTVGRGYIECHHLLPLAAAPVRATRLSDLALLCANCHRIAHRIRPWPSVQDLIALTNADSPEAGL